METETEKRIMELIICSMACARTAVAAIDRLDDTLAVADLERINRNLRLACAQMTQAISLRSGNPEPERGG